MTTLLLNLRQVPDDEAEDVRHLLEQHQIPFYETTPSLWGISSGGIWLNNPEDRERARALMEDYQQQRARQQREAFEQARRDGTAPTLWQRLRHQPLRALGVLIAVLVLLLVTLAPFLALGKGG
ncbi:hypothetical protein A11A3_13390 [Alcanivorax hongdengensis A-11-3]|uniref:DUF2007 domain-containing protein n=1 Tax=Alcanivorax hongdengensis A-11-3 TaxID=1177179 RepID=L0W980_9GAMM|nr:DUF6164 family protein [Alcanivorax hongdengensis]EKF73534.1 hypothetical protein A11A3_13390 [Alcanivorax hongdengensis A-11-3]